MTEIENNAAFETVGFAKSDHEQTSTRIVAAVNAFFRAIDLREAQKSLERSPLF